MAYTSLLWLRRLLIPHSCPIEIELSLVPSPCPRQWGVSKSCGMSGCLGHDASITSRPSLEPEFQATHDHSAAVAILIIHQLSRSQLTINALGKDRLQRNNLKILSNRPVRLHPVYLNFSFYTHRLTTQQWKTTRTMQG